TVQSLGSGSSGNAFILEYRNQTLLLDCGVGIRTLTRALRERHRRLDDLDAILITHEHGDHICTLPRLAGLDVPVVATAGTKKHLPIPDAQWQPIATHQSVEIAGITVWAIAVDHDAVEPCGYLIEAGATRVSIFTDLGCWHDRLAEPILASDLIVLEANHDLDMLRHGPYPMHLKRRVASTKGHLSNTDAGSSLAATLRHAATSPSIWLAHLSDTNNTPVMAHGTVVGALLDAGVGAPVTPLPRRVPGPIWTGAGATRTDAWQPLTVPPSVAQLSLDFTG
ncbi:MAG TPA: MBL fold metallo-hydrolase, partial [Thermomicrobiales bacterium]|nr:MBL fold metallo-hydrolase [Thermomicrobiales bacterium]